MDATEFTEKGKGAKLTTLYHRVYRFGGPVAASKRALDHLHTLINYRFGDGCEDYGHLRCNVALRRRRAPLTAADLDRIARAEV